MMACLQTILRDEFQTFGNSSKRSSSRTLNLTKQSIIFDELAFSILQKSKDATLMNFQMQRAQVDST